MSEKLIHRQTIISPQVERRTTPVQVNPVNIIEFKREKQTEHEENRRNKNIQYYEERIAELSNSMENTKKARNGFAIFATGVGASAVAVETHDHAAGAVLLGGLSVMTGGAAVSIEALRILMNKSVKWYQEAIEKLKG